MPTCAGPGGCALGGVDEHAADAVGDAHRLLPALGIDGEAGDDLVPSASHVGDLNDLRVAAQACSHDDRSWKADLVPAVVDAQRETAPIVQIVAQAIDQREGEVAV